MKNFIQKLLPFDDLYATAMRFPLSVFCAVSLFIIAFLSVHDVIDPDETWLGRIVAVLGCGYFLFGIITLMAESQGWSRKKNGIISVIGMIAIAALIFSTTLWAYHLIFIVPALLLFLMFAPYMTSGDDLSVWFFNRMMWFGVAVSYVALFLFAGGLSTALMAIHTLFDVDIPEELYADIWFFASLVLGPLYALSWIPKTFEFSKGDCHDPPGLKFLMNWISVPMVLVYFLILYAYFGKIVITGEVPNGHLAYLITGFAGAGVITYLSSFPLREEGSIQLRLFHKVFFIALIIPVGFHFYAIWERVSAYGMTEQRYLIMLSAVWFMILALGNVFGKMPIKAIPMTLGILLVFASIGPWGGVSVSGSSQFSRLESLLIKNALLVDGKIIKAQDESSVTLEDRKNISSILDYLCRTGRDARVEPLFNIEGKKDWSCSRGHTLVKQLGFKYVGRYHRVNGETRFNVYARSQTLRSIDGYSLYIQGKSINVVDDHDDKTTTKPTCTLDNDQDIHVFLNDQGEIIFKRDGDIILRENIQKFIRDHAKDHDREHPIILDLESDLIKARLFVQSMRGDIVDTIPHLNYMRIDMAFTMKELR